MSERHQVRILESHRIDAEPLAIVEVEITRSQDHHGFTSWSGSVDSPGEELVSREGQALYMDFGTGDVLRFFFTKAGVGSDEQRWLRFIGAEGRPPCHETPEPR